MGNACDCGVSNILFTTSSDNKRSVNGRSYGEGTTGDSSLSSSINDSISMDGNRTPGTFRVNDSSNAFFRTPTTKRTSRASGGSGRSGGEEGGGNERGSYTRSPEGLGLSSDGEGGVGVVMSGKGGGRSEVDRFILPSPIPVSTTKHEEDMWDNLRHDLRVLDENLTRDTEIFKALPLDALSGGRGGGSRGNSSSGSSSGSGGGISRSGIDSSSSSSSSSSSMRGEGTYGGNNLGVVVDEEERRRREDQVQSVPLEVGEQLDLMAEAEDALRMIEEEVYSEEDGDRGEELRESWEQENDDLSFNIHDSWDQSL